MTRKKISADGNAAAVIDLDDDEQLEKTVTTKTTIGKSKKAADKSKDDEVIEALPVIDDDEAAEAEQMQFSETSLAGLLTNDDEDDFANQFCTINVRREPDSLNDRFLTPCSVRTNLRPLRNVELTAEIADIEDRVLELVGGSGGHYFFQIQYNGRLAKSWKSTLADDLGAVARAKLEKEREQNPSPATPMPTQNPFDAFLENLEKQQRLRDLLFGPDKERYERELAELRAEVAAAKQNPAEQKSEKLSLLETALASQSDGARDRILNHLFPSDEPERRHWIADTVEIVIQNKDAILGVIGSLVGGVVPAEEKTKPQSIEEMMRGQAPKNLGEATTTLPAAGFQRKQRPSESEPSDGSPTSEIAKEDATDKSDEAVSNG